MPPSLGCYVAGIGWVGPNDHREPFGETQQVIAEILLDIRTKNDAFWAGRKRIRLLALERINQTTGERAMLRAIKAKDFRRCIDLAVRRGITIDLETPEGFTVMLCAAEENVDATNHNTLGVNDWFARSYRWSLVKERECAESSASFPNIRARLTFRNRAVGRENHGPPLALTTYI
jgi:hypothetical protein